MPNKSFGERIAGWFKRKSSSEGGLKAKSAVPLTHNPLYNPLDSGDPLNSGASSQEGGFSPQDGGYLDVSARGGSPDLSGEGGSPPQGGYYLDVSASAEDAIPDLSGEGGSPPPAAPYVDISPDPVDVVYQDYGLMSVSGSGNHCFYVAAAAQMIAWWKDGKIKEEQVEVLRVALSGYLEKDVPLEDAERMLIQGLSLADASLILGVALRQAIDPGVVNRGSATVGESDEALPGLLEYLGLDEAIYVDYRVGESDLGASVSQYKKDMTGDVPVVVSDGLSSEFSIFGVNVEEGQPSTTPLFGYIHSPESKGHFTVICKGGDNPTGGHYCIPVHKGLLNPEYILGRLGAVPGAVDIALKPGFVTHIDSDDGLDSRNDPNFNWYSPENKQKLLHHLGFDSGLEADVRSAGYGGGLATAVLPAPPVLGLVASSGEDGLTEGGLTAEAFRKLVEDRLSRDHIERIVAVQAEGSSILATIQQKERLLSILQGSEEVGAADYLAALNIAMHQRQGEGASRIPHQDALLGALKHCSESSSANQNHLVASLAMSRVAILMPNEERRLTSSEVSKVVKSISVDGTQIKQNCADRSEVEKTFEVLAKDDSITSYFLNVHESSGEIQMQGKHLVEYLQGAAKGIASHDSANTQVFKLTQDKQEDHLRVGFTSEQMCQLVRIADILQKQGKIEETDRLTAIVDKVGQVLEDNFTIENMTRCQPSASPDLRVGGSAGGRGGRGGP